MSITISKYNLGFEYKVNRKLENLTKGLDLFTLEVVIDKTYREPSPLHIRIGDFTEIPVDISISRADYSLTAISIPIIEGQFVEAEEDKIGVKGMDVHDNGIPMFNFKPVNKLDTRIDYEVPLEYYSLENELFIMIPGIERKERQFNTLSENLSIISSVGKTDLRLIGFSILLP